MLTQQTDSALQPQTPEQIREAKLAMQRIAVFERRYGPAALKLACHAAFPMALTAELVYCLRENFDDLQDVPWFAAADILLSGLCQPIGYDLFEMPGSVRIELLKRLKNEFGESRVWALEDLMGDYILAQLGLEEQQAKELGRESRQRSRIFGDRPGWTALCCLRPGEVRGVIEQEIQRIWQDLSERKRLHISSMIESYAALLPGEPILLQWAEQVVDEVVPSSSWDDWAAQLGIVLQPQVVQVARIRFADEPHLPEADLNPNLLRQFTFDLVTLDGRGAEAERKTLKASYFVEPLGLGVPPLELVAIPGGRFLMGSPQDEPERFDDEGPQHWVDVPPFFMGKYPVTQAQWRFVAGLPQIDRKLDPDPAGFKGDDRPVEQVSWHDAQEFCARVSQLSQRTCRLPSESEWEYACRAGTTMPFHFGKTISPDWVNYNGNYTFGKGSKGVYRGETTSVGHFGVANAFGLFDMHGNVYEWCEDHWHNEYEAGNAPTDGSAWIDAKATKNANRVLRGGSWYVNPRYCRSACRINYSAGFRNYYFIGFRVVYSSARILL